MFDLEESISEWRNQMLAAGIRSPVPLEELEAHLRAEIREGVGSGLGEQRAFENAVEQVGSPYLIALEFGKVRPVTKARPVSQRFSRAMILIGGAASLVSFFSLRWMQAHEAATLSSRLRSGRMSQMSLPEMYDAFAGGTFGEHFVSECFVGSLILTGLFACLASCRRIENVDPAKTLGTFLPLRVLRSRRSKMGRGPG